MLTEDDLALKVAEHITFQGLVAHKPVALKTKTCTKLPIKMKSNENGWWKIKLILSIHQCWNNFVVYNLNIVDGNCKILTMNIKRTDRLIH